MNRHVRRALVIGFAVTAGAFAAFPLATHFKTPAAERAARIEAVLAAWPRAAHWPGSQNKDYGLWHPVGLVARSERELYPTDPGVYFPFMYPPFAAAALGGLSHLGPDGMLVALVLGNVGAWLAAVWLGVRLVASRPREGTEGRAPADAKAGARPSVPSRGRLATAAAPPLTWGLPSLLGLFFVYDMFLLGQPNLLLLVLMLVGFHALRAGRGGWAGAAFATAVALKAFPAVVLPYLLWRRQWAAAVGMVGVTAGLLLLAPLPARGWDRNLRDLGTWADGMILTPGGQRPEQSLGWRNQSLTAVVKRLTSPVNAEADELIPPTPPVYVNLVSLSPAGASVAAAAACGLVGLAFVAVLPRRSARTPDTDAAEWGLLTVLVVIGTPYCFTYYFVWLLFPTTVLVARRRWGFLAVGHLLMLAGAPLTDSKVPAAAGAVLWGAVVLAAGLGRELRRPS